MQAAWKYAASFEHITAADYRLLAGLLAGGYVYIFHVVDSPLFKSQHFDALHQKCLVACGSDACSACTRKLRDSNYYLDSAAGNKVTAHMNCAFTL